jgi:hypothetical protein
LFGFFRPGRDRDGRSDVLLSGCSAVAAEHLHNEGFARRQQQLALLIAVVIGPLDPRCARNGLSDLKSGLLVLGSNVSISAICSTGRAACRR